MSHFLQLVVFDFPSEGIGQVRDEWINPDRIESIAPHLEIEKSGGDQVWLELTMASGPSKYVPVGPLAGRNLLAVAGDAIRTFFGDDSVQPVVAYSM
ncbi:hypothetical protein [Naasia lichenicola]|uniref:Uncharacterized protein n=1 Tax=Naasia lichenicola TaxID=2565933 RepID=A0A4V3WST2_9MICO|nr:hypothetical protein [Naasia lichenicola]THG29317.1 hypothetical protein E6C64_11390 [Naasia lichenicola]